MIKMPISYDRETLEHINVLDADERTLFTVYSNSENSIMTDEEEASVQEFVRLVNGGMPVCGVCAGEGRPMSNKACICGGAGTQDAEVIGLRKALHEANTEIEKLKGEG